ncbi:pre-rRNA processing protein [Kickxella alabastrina]|uniref:Pre-rRNA processing protein n=1 Tax=Kickxella alabastrina TaxID=61397 RepID=A0ACC1IWY6_9FUNG|nr:pre-rRNA processing protein [Kickxella alabastrina]
MDSELEVQLKKLRTQLNSKAAHQQQHAATLLAVEETIKEQHMVAEPASYFAALLTLLEQSDSGSNGLTGAIIYLLSIILPFVSHNTLRAKFTAMMAVLAQSLDLGSADVALLRSVISCLETLLAAQDAGSWGQPIAQGTFKSLLALATDSKPKIRKRAQEAVSKLLSSPPAPAVVHPAAGATAEFVVEALLNAKAETPAAMYTLQLIKQTDMLWPEEAFGELCEALMQLPKLNTPYITTLSFQALESVFSSATESLDEDQFRDLLISIIDLKPNMNDPLASEAWLKIIQKGYASYATISPEACFQSLPDLIDLMFPDIEMGKQSTREVATQCIWAMMRECIPDSKLGSAGVAKIVKTISTGLSYRYRESWTLVFLLIAALFQRLGKFAHPAMDAVLTEVANMRMEPDFELKNEADAVLGAAVRAVGPQAFLEVLPLNLDADQRKGDVGRAWLLPLMKGHVRNAPLRYFVETMLPLADSLAARSLQFVTEGREIEAKVFSALSLQVWALLGGFCNVPADILQAFTPEFAERLANEMLELPAARPAICGALQTLLTAVHTIAHSEAGTGPLTQQQALAAEMHLARFAPDYLSQLFNIFAQSPGASRGFLMDTINTFLTVIMPAEINATFVKVCTMLDEALKAHTPPAAAELTERYLEAHPPPNAYTMMDLATAMTAYLDAERAQMLVRAAFVLAKQNDDAILQKKGYKAISRLAEQPTESPARQLIEEIMTAQLIPMLVESAETVAVSSRRERLTLIASLSRSLTDEQLHFVPAMLSEAILGTKEANERARNVAFETLLTMGRRMAMGGVINMAAVTGEAAEDESMEVQHQASIEEYFKMTAAGLAAQTPHMISATVAAISRALFEFHEQLSTSFVLDIMSTVLMFVVNNNREIAKASLGFVKIIVVILPKEVLLPHLAEIVKSILKWSHEFKNQMRLKCRHILDRLVRRLGLETVAKVTPEEHVRLVANMRKRQERSKRGKDGKMTAEDEDIHAEATANASASAAGKKSFGNAYEDVLYGSESELDDSDDDDVDTRAAGSKGAKSKTKLGRKGEDARGQSTAPAAGTANKGAWIKEDTDGPLDFLDRSAFTHFATADPAAAKVRRTPTAPKMKDGKLFFDDPEEEARKAAAIAAASASAAAADDEVEQEDYYLQSLQSKDGFYRTPNQKIKFHKRKAGDDDNDVEMASDGEAAPQKPAAKRGKDSNGAAFGREFRSRKAQGDVKRGSIDPFAYIPLNPKNMKKGTISIKGNSKKDKRARNAK